MPGNPINPFDRGEDLRQALLNIATGRGPASAISPLPQQGPPQAQTPFDLSRVPFDKNRTPFDPANSSPFFLDTRGAAESLKKNFGEIPRLFGAEGSSPILDLIGQGLGGALNLTTDLGEGLATGVRAIGSGLGSVGDFFFTGDTPGASGAPTPVEKQPAPAETKAAPPPRSPFGRTEVSRFKLPEGLFDKPPSTVLATPDLTPFREALAKAAPVVRSEQQLKELGRNTFLGTLSSGLSQLANQTVSTLGDELNIIGTSLLQARVASSLTKSEASREDQEALRQYNLAVASSRLEEIKFLREADREKKLAIAAQHNAAFQEMMQTMLVTGARIQTVSDGILVTSVNSDNELVTEFIRTKASVDKGVQAALTAQVLGANGVFMGETQNDAVSMLTVGLWQNKANWGKIFGDDLQDIIQESLEQVAPISERLNLPKEAEAALFVEQQSVLLNRLVDLLLVEDSEALVQLQQINPQLFAAINADLGRADGK